MLGAKRFMTGTRLSNKQEILLYCYSIVAVCEIPFLLLEEFTYTDLSNRYTIILYLCHT